MSSNPSAIIHLHCQCIALSSPTTAGISINVRKPIIVSGVTNPVPSHFLQASFHDRNPSVSMPWRRKAANTHDMIPISYVSRYVFSNFFKVRKQQTLKHGRIQTASNKPFFHQESGQQDNRGIRPSRRIPPLIRVSLDSRYPRTHYGGLCVWWSMHVVPRGRVTVMTLCVSCSIRIVSSLSVPPRHPSSAPT